MLIQISNQLAVYKQNLNLNVVESKFTHPNPRFWENRRLGFSVFGVPREISLFTPNGEMIYFPRGLFSEVASLEPDKDDLEIIDKTITNSIRFKTSGIILKKYQLLALEAMLSRNQGILVAPPGSGKTVVGIELIIKRAQKSLILVHTKDLLQQWINRFKQFTNITPGVIDADRYDLQEVTIGMVQSLRKPLDGSFLNQWGLVTLDECHHAPAYSFETLLNQFPAKYRYGLTATPIRRDGLSFILHAVLGSTIFTINKEGLFEDGEIIRPLIKVVMTNFYNPRIFDYRSLLEAIVLNAERNTLIIKNIVREAEEGHFCLVLSNRIDHAQWINRTLTMVYPDLNSQCLTSKVSKDERIAVISLVNDGKVKVLCATQLADEGLDLRRLDRLFLTCPVRSINKVNQQIGRIVRTFPGKKEAVVYDFRDPLCSLAESQFQTRLKMVYQTSGYDVEEIPFEGDGHEC